MAAVAEALSKLTSSPNPELPTDAEVDVLRSKYASVQQDHVFAFWDDLSSDEKTVFYKQLLSIDPERVAVRHPIPFARSRFPRAPDMIANPSRFIETLPRSAPPPSSARDPRRGAPPRLCHRLHPRLP